MKKIPTLISANTDKLCIGTTAQIKTENKKVLIGAIRNIIELDGLGIMVSLDNNLIASAKLAMNQTNQQH